jgi:hypothetical protein
MRRDIDVSRGSTASVRSDKGCVPSIQIQFGSHCEEPKWCQFGILAQPSIHGVWTAFHQHRAYCVGIETPFGSVDTRDGHGGASYTKSVQYIAALFEPFQT